MSENLAPAKPVEIGKAQPVIRDAKPGRAVHALLIGDRLVVDRSGFDGVVSTAPFCFRKADGYAVVFRYGALVLIGLSAEDEKDVIAQFAQGNRPIEEERIAFEIHPDKEEGIGGGGLLYMRELTVAHALVIGDILAKSVALARYEREVASVFDTIEPEASALAVSGKLPNTRKALLQMIGSALLAQHRVSGRIAFAEKPDVLWERPELERFYARLEDEFEIVERGTLLNGKVAVVANAAETFTDLVDTQRSARLELLIVILILAELIIAAGSLFHF
ncbi:MAG TPA: RMD1 family protein [Rhizomicrobium sp.]|nr:RMD1 family protein [Rhizomicrobium sp.]